jgi:hypothetical protein
MANKPVVHNPGDPAPHSGIYLEVGPRGGQTGDSAVSVEGRPLPPTSQPGNGWILGTPSDEK